MSDLLTLGKQVLASQRFSLWTMRSSNTVSFTAESSVTPPTTRRLLAGGLVFEGAPVAKSEFKINYLKPATGERLIACASIVHAGKNQVVCRGDVFVADADAAGTLCAVAQGPIVTLQANLECDLLK